MDTTGTPISESIGSVLREWREGQGLTCRALGDAVGLSPGKISEIETGKYTPGVKAALAIEAMSAGADGVPRINAADLNDDVKAARHGVVVTAPAAGASPGKADENSRDVPAGAARAV